MSLKTPLRHALLLGSLMLMSAAGFASADEKLAGLERIPTVEIVDQITDLEPHLVYLEDPDGALQIDDVLTQLDAFEPVPNGDANFGLKTSVYWFAVKVENNRDERIHVLAVTYPLLDYLEVHNRSYNGASIQQVQKTGDMLPFSERYLQHRTPNTRQTYDSQNRALVLLRVRTDGSVQVPLRVSTERAFGELAARENAGLFFYYGIMAVMILYNAFLWIQTRAQAYVSYVLFLIGFGIVSMSLNGTLFQWLLPEQMELAGKVLLVVGFLTYSAGTRFARIYNSIVTSSGLLAGALLTFERVCLSVAAVIWLVPYGVGIKVGALFMLIFPCVILFTGFQSLRCGYRPARYFLTAWIMFLGGVVVYGLKTAGILPQSFFTEYAIQFGSALEVTLLSLGLGDRMNLISEERDASNKALLETYQKLDSELLKRESLQAINTQLQQDNDAAGQQLIQADKLATLGTLVAGVAHDIASPTGLGKAAGELIAESREELEAQFHQLLGDDDGEEVTLIRKQFNALFESIREGEEDIALATTRIGAINNAIRNQSRIEEGMNLTSVRPIIDECVTIVKSRLVGIKTEVECSDALMAALNRSQFGQVLMNLLANGADAIREKETSMRDAGKAFSGELRIRAIGDSPEAFELTIEDNGPGIPEDIRAKILEPFFTTKEVGKGTGLGMPIVIRILEHHGLKLEIGDSEALGGAKLRISHSQG